MSHRASLNVCVCVCVCEIIHVFRTYATPQVTNEYFRTYMRVFEKT